MTGAACRRLSFIVYRAVVPLSVRGIRALARPSWVRSLSLSLSLSLSMNVRRETRKRRKCSYSWQKLPRARGREAHSQFWNSAVTCPHHETMIDPTRVHQDFSVHWAHCNRAMCNFEGRRPRSKVWDFMGLHRGPCKHLSFGFSSSPDQAQSFFVNCAGRFANVCESVRRELRHIRRAWQLKRELKWISLVEKYQLYHLLCGGRAQAVFGGQQVSIGALSSCRNRLVKEFLDKLYLCKSMYCDQKNPVGRIKYKTMVQPTSSQNFGKNLLHDDGVASLVAELRGESTSRRWCCQPRRRTSQSLRRSSSANIITWSFSAL